MAAYLKLLRHGGLCCGIKHIHGFFNHPTTGLEDAMKLTAGSGAGSNYFTGSRPEETAVTRLNAFLAYLLNHNPKGLIEVTLVGYQKTLWKKTLEERGFNLVTEFINSNTGQRIYVYHKICGTVPKLKS